MEDLSELTAVAEAKTSGGFIRVKPPLLGFALERSSSTDRHRLVAVAEKDAEPGMGDVVLEGTLHACEARFLEELSKRHGKGFPNLPLATRGGQQFWADVEILAGWRIQQHVYTGHHRLLDTREVRRAWGSYEACRTALEEARAKQGLRPRSAQLVVILHGLGRTKSSFSALKRTLEDEGYEVADVCYPSTRRQLRQHALQVAGILERAHGFESVSFVTHSLGGIVVRDLLSLDGGWKRRMGVGRLVMLAPPSRGSIVADLVKEWLPARVVLGKVIEDLTTHSLEKIPAPSCEFGIIAGGTGKSKGLNPILPGDNDGVVTVESTRLDGAKDFLLLDVGHTFIMVNEESIQATIRFLKTGKFAAAG